MSYTTRKENFAFFLEKNYLNFWQRGHCGVTILGQASVLKFLARGLSIKVETTLVKQATMEPELSSHNQQPLNL